MPSPKKLKGFQPSSPLTLFTTAWEALSAPRQFFSTLESTAPLPPLLFLFLVLFIPALASGLLGAAPEGASGIPGALGMAVLQHLAMAWFIFLAARFVVKSPLTACMAIAVYAYSAGVWLLSPLGLLFPPPGGDLFLALLALIHLYLISAGLQVTGDMSFPMAIACLIMAVVAIFLGALLAGWLFA